MQEQCVLPWSVITNPSKYGWSYAFEHDIQLRLKPSPKFRTWKACEAPVGKLIMDKTWGNSSYDSGPSLILGSCESAVMFFNIHTDKVPTNRSMSYVLEHCL